MTNLADVEGKPISWHYDKWGVDVLFIPLSASALVTLSTDFAKIHTEEVSNVEALRYQAEILALTVTDPKATAEEWMQTASAATIAELATKACELSGLLAEEKKTVLMSDR